jgi:FdhD protein
MDVSYSGFMNSAPVAALSILKVTGDSAAPAEDLVAVEEPLALVLGYGGAHGREQRELAITMRTPGSDLELALGFLFSEGLVRSMEEVQSVRHCSGDGRDGGEGNLVKIELADGVELPGHIFARHSFVSSSCGICGKASIEAVRAAGFKEACEDGALIRPAVLHALPEAVRSAQRVFGVTGGLHAAALFDYAGSLIALREDVGRHNAVDKLIGHALAAGRVPLSGRILFLSGRASFELLQKASMAGLGVVCSVGAPSSLAVRCARDFGITLAGFLREGRFNLYSGAHRIEGCGPAAEV